MNTLTLIDGYDKRKNPATTTYRAMTAEEAKLLRAGMHVPFLGLSGKAFTAKVNGAPRTWKRDPERVEVSLKYGLRDCFTDSADRADGTMRRLLVPVAE